MLYGRVRTERLQRDKEIELSLVKKEVKKVEDNSNDTRTKVSKSKTKTK